MFCFYLFLVLYLTFNLVFIKLVGTFLLPSVDYALAFYSGVVLFNAYVPSTGRCFRHYSSRPSAYARGGTRRPRLVEVDSYRNQGSIADNKNQHSGQAGKPASDAIRGWRVPKGTNRYNLMWLSGFIEGDGCFSVSGHSGAGGTITYVLSIGLHSDDLSLLYEISSMLKGQGRIYESRGYNVRNRNVVQFKLQNKYESTSTSLGRRVPPRAYALGREVFKSVVLPIFDTYSYLTPKFYGYTYFKDCLLSNILRYDDLSRFSITTNTPYNTVNELLNVPYYDVRVDLDESRSTRTASRVRARPTWLVGFINAEGSFFINNRKGVPVDACFKITQTGAPQIIESIKVRLSLSVRVGKTSTSLGRRVPPRAYALGRPAYLYTRYTTLMKLDPLAFKT